MYDFTLQELESSPVYQELTPDEQKQYSQEYVSENGVDDVLSQLDNTVNSAEYEELTEQDQSTFYSNYLDYYGIDKAVVNQSKEGDFMGGVKRGLYQTGASFAGVAGLAADAIGYDKGRDVAFDAYKDLVSKAEEHRARVSRVEDIGSLDDAIDWLQGGVGSQVPVLISMALSGGVGAAAGKKLLTGAIKKAVSNKVASGTARDVARKQVTAQFHKASAMTGLGAGVSAMEAGGMWGEDAAKRGVEEANALSAFLLGSVSGASEALFSPVGKVVGRMLGVKKVGAELTQTFLKRLGIGLPLTAAKEGTQEVFQEWLGIINEKIQDPDVSLIDKKALSQYLNAGSLGAVMGAGAGSVNVVFPEKSLSVTETEQAVSDIPLDAEPDKIVSFIEEEIAPPPKEELPEVQPDTLGDQPTLDTGQINIPLNNEARDKAEVAELIQHINTATPEDLAKVSGMIDPLIKSNPHLAGYKEEIDQALTARKETLDPGLVPDVIAQKEAVSEEKAPEGKVQITDAPGEVADGRGIDTERDTAIEVSAEKPTGQPVADEDKRVDVGTDISVKGEIGPELVLKDGVVDVELTEGKLPPIKEGHVRIYRAESPTVKFDDVFDKVKEGDQFYTDNLSYADYFRATYGKDAIITYKDITYSQAKSMSIGGGEYSVPIPTRTKSDIAETAKQVMPDLRYEGKGVEGHSFTPLSGVSKGGTFTVAEPTKENITKALKESQAAFEKGIADRKVFDEAQKKDDLETGMDEYTTENNAVNDLKDAQKEVDRFSLHEGSPYGSTEIKRKYSETYGEESSNLMVLLSTIHEQKKHITNLLEKADDLKGKKDRWKEYNKVKKEIEYRSNIISDTAFKLVLLRKSDVKPQGVKEPIETKKPPPKTKTEVAAKDDIEVKEEKTKPGKKEPAVEVTDKSSIAHGQKVDTAPGEKQIEAENYQTAKINIDGLKLSIENPVGSTRSGKDVDGKEWSQKMKADYGRILGSVGFDKDHVDMFVKPGYKGGAKFVYVVNQHNKDGSFDEHKSILGVESEQEALDLYNSNYEKGWTGGKSVTRIGIGGFKKWVQGVGPSRGALIRKNTFKPGMALDPSQTSKKVQKQAKTDATGGMDVLPVPTKLPLMFEKSRWSEEKKNKELSKYKKQGYISEGSATEVIGSAHGFTLSLNHVFGTQKITEDKTGTTLAIGYNEKGEEYFDVGGDWESLKKVGFDEKTFTIDEDKIKAYFSSVGGTVKSIEAPNQPPVKPVKTGVGIVAGKAKEIARKTKSDIPSEKVEVSPDKNVISVYQNESGSRTSTIRKSRMTRNYLVETVDADGNIVGGDVKLYREYASEKAAEEEAQKSTGISGKKISITDEQVAGREGVKFSKAKDSYVGEHEAPTNDGYAKPLHDMTDIYPDDIYSSNGARYYGDGSRFDQESVNILRGLRDRPNKSVKVYRAVPKVMSVQEQIDEYKTHKAHILRRGKLPAGVTNWPDSSSYFDYIYDEINRLEKSEDATVSKRPTINIGDWVTINRKYAVEHGKSALNNQYRIVSKTVKARHVFTDGNSIHEQGYDPRSKESIVKSSKSQLSPKKQAKGDFKVDENNRKFTNALQRVLSATGLDIDVSPMSVPKSLFRFNRKGRVDNSRPPASDFDMAKRIARIFGKSVVWSKIGDAFGFNGMVSRQGILRDKIFLDVRSNVLQHVVLGHELSHHMEADVPQVYDELVKSLTPMLNNIELYREKSNIGEMPDKAVIKEMIGDLLGNSFTDPTFWGEVAQQNPGKFRIIANTVMKWLNKIFNKLNKNIFNTEGAVSDIEASRAALAKATSEYATLRRGATKEKPNKLFSEAFKYSSKEGINEFAQGVKMSVKVADPDIMRSARKTTTTIDEDQFAGSGVFTGAKTRAMQLVDKYMPKERRDKIYTYLADQDLAISQVQRQIKKQPESRDYNLLRRLTGKKIADEIKQFDENVYKPLIDKMAKGLVEFADVHDLGWAQHAPERNLQMKRVNAKRYIDSMLQQYTGKQRESIDDQLIDIQTEFVMDNQTRNDRRDNFVSLMDGISLDSKQNLKDVEQAQKELNNREFTQQEIDKGTPEFKQKRMDSLFRKAERRIEISDKWEDVKDRLSGMTDKEAKDSIAEFKKRDNFAAIQESVDDLRKINESALDMNYAAGELTEEEYNAIKNTYKKHVPLYREDMDDSKGATGRVGIGPLASPIKIAAGSTKGVVDIFGHVIDSYQSAIQRKHKLEAGKVLYDMIKANPDESRWSIVELEKKPYHDKEGNIRYYPDQVLADNEVYVKINGVKKIIHVPKDNKQMMRFMEALKREPADLGPVLQASQKITRTLAQLNTSFSPEFIISNFFRDLQTAGVHIETTEVAGMQKKVFKNLKAAIKGIYNEERGKESGEWGKIYRSFSKSGGKIGWMQGYENVEELAKNLEKDLAYAKGERPKRKKFRELTKFVEAMNVSVENGVRLATYKQLIDSGVSERRAAHTVANLTVDFTRKGTAGPAMNALWMFANAGIQGNVRMIKALSTNKKVQSIAKGIFATGMAVNIMGAVLGGDDEDGEAYYDKLKKAQPSLFERNIILMIPGTDGKYIKIPMPYGYNTLFVAGNEVASALRGGNPIEGMSSIMSTFMNTFNPLGSATLLQTIMPTVGDPIAQVFENKAWHGGDLMPGTNPFGIPKPDSERYFKSVNPVLKSATSWVNRLTGGSDIKPGAISVSPETLEMLVETYTGSLGRFIKDIFSLPVAAISGDLEVRKIPGLRKVFGVKSQYQNRTIYFDNKGDIQQFTAEFKASTPQEKRKLLSDKRRKMMEFTKNTESILKKLRKALRVATGERKEQIKKRMDNIYVKYNERYNKL